MQKFPNSILYRLLSELYLEDLKNLFLTSKFYGQICYADKFWLQKILFDFPKFIKCIPDNITPKQWYLHIFHSGNLYSSNKDNFIASNIIKAVHNCIGLFHIDIFHNLYFYGKPYQFLTSIQNYYCMRKYANINDDYYNMKLDTDIKDFCITDDDCIYIEM